MGAIDENNGSGREQKGPKDDVACVGCAVCTVLSFGVDNMLADIDGPFKPLLSGVSVSVAPSLMKLSGCAELKSMPG